MNAGGSGHGGCGPARHRFSAYCVLVVSLIQNLYGFHLSYLFDVSVDDVKLSGVYDLGRVKVSENEMRMLNVYAYDAPGTWSSL